ncbi:hypothetical protein MMC06_005965 [Schaereria dolodes]|nr:hypothetical protein [Schaereria dolodes]
MTPRPHIPQSVAKPVPATSTGIRNTWLRRALTIASVRLPWPFKRWDGVLMLPFNICIKGHQGVHLNEAETLVFVFKNTTIPVPKVYCAFERKGVTYIVMQKIKGDMLRQHWWTESEGAQKDLSEETKASLLSQLHDYIVQLRSIPPLLPGKVGDINYSRLYDDRIQGLGFGPFETIRDFHKFLRNGTTTCPSIPEAEQVTVAHEREEYVTCFTHGDLNTFNIMVRNGKVVGILDWEMAGWFPDYWEYTSAWHVDPYDAAWREEVGKFLNPYPEELKIEKLRRKWYSGM